MEIKINDELAARFKEHLQKIEMNRPAEFVIEELIEGYIENWPFNSWADICVYGDECMHHKTVSEWKEENK